MSGSSSAGCDEGYFQNPHYVIMFFFVHTSACNECTFSGALAPQPPRQAESRKMQKLLPETAMKELHSQAPGGKRLKQSEDIIWHLGVLEV